MKTYAVILAAGKGTRFGKSKVNKTAVEINGKSIVQLGIEKLFGLVDEIVVVVGHKKETVINSISGGNIHYVVQSKRLGTGHAVKIALNFIQNNLEHPNNILIANGDHLFMLNHKVINGLLFAHNKSGSKLSILSMNHDNPYGLDNGRIIRINGLVADIIEKRDCSEVQLKSIKELNTGTYVVGFRELHDLLKNEARKANQELYLTKLLLKLTTSINTYTAKFEEVGTGVNTKEDLNNFLQKLDVMETYV